MRRNGTPRFDPVTGEKIKQLSPKQVLGLDDANYLGVYPMAEGSSNLEVHPAYVAPQFDRLPGTGIRIPPPDPGQVAIRGINPWDVEHGPNSVIFPHLVECPVPELHGDSIKKPQRILNVEGSHAEGSRSSNRMETLSDLMKRHKRSRWGGRTADPEDELEMTELPSSPFANARPHNTASPEVELEIMESSSSEETARSGSSIVADDSSRTLSPATTNSTLSRMDKGKGPARDLELSPTEAMELTTFAATIPEQSHEVLITDIDSVWPAAAIPVISLPVTHGGPSHSTEFRCSKCNQSFRLPGLLKNHENRKHNLRYGCHLCEAAFGLRADLERHKATKHSNELGQKPTKVYKCPNTDCSTPEKEYFRKDNFMRHTRRCKKAKIKLEEKNQASETSGRSQHLHDGVANWDTEGAWYSILKGKKHENYALRSATSNSYCRSQKLAPS